MREIEIGFREINQHLHRRGKADDSQLEFQGKNSAIKGILVQGLDQELKHIKGLGDRSHD
jgi:hypothetical protein